MDELFTMILMLLFSNPQYSLTATLTEQSGVGNVITWNAIPWAESITLERKTGDGDFVALKTLSGHPTSVTDSTAAFGQIYTYRVKYSHPSFSEYSNEMVYVAPIIDDALMTKMTYNQTPTSNIMWIDFEFGNTNVDGVVYIDWGDGNFEVHKVAEHIALGDTYVYIEHPYAANGEYIIKTYSTKKLNYIDFGEITKLLDWGSPKDIVIQMPSIYLVEVPATLHPDITDMTLMFGSAEIFNQDISNWNTSNVTKMRGTFSYAKSFNQPIGNWNVAQVTDFSTCFYSCRDFNQDLSGWNTRSGTTMFSMFDGAIVFNQPIGNWNVSKVTNMEQMLYGAQQFNQNLSGWCVSLIPTEPNLFSTGSLLTLSNKPVWGTCPTN